jgi:hypothetical protein
MAVTYRTSTLEDADILAPRMREQDAREVFLSHGVSPGEALRISCGNSKESFTIIDGNKDVVGMFGYVDESNRKGVPWLLGSDKLVEKKNHRSFLVQSQHYVNSLKVKYDTLYNYVHAENTVSFQWLQWLGFSIGQELKNWGLNNGTFIKFSWKRR